MFPSTQALSLSPCLYPSVPPCPCHRQRHPSVYHEQEDAFLCHDHQPYHDRVMAPIGPIHALYLDELLFSRRVSHRPSICGSHHPSLCQGLFADGYDHICRGRRDRGHRGHGGNDRPILDGDSRLCRGEHSHLGGGHHDRHHDDHVCHDPFHLCPSLFGWWKAHAVDGTLSEDVHGCRDLFWNSPSLGVYMLGILFD